MSLDTSLAPVLFELEQPPKPAGRSVARRPGHTVRVFNTAAGAALVVCACGDKSPARAKPNDVIRWLYQHLDVVYDSDIEEAVHA